jgi:hypothetical protein
MGGDIGLLRAAVKLQGDGLIAGRGDPHHINNKRIRENSDG